MTHGYTVHFDFRLRLNRSAIFGFWHVEMGGQWRFSNIIIESVVIQPSHWRLHGLCGLAALIGGIVGGFRFLQRFICYIDTNPLGAGPSVSASRLTEGFRRVLMLRAKEAVGQGYGLYALCPTDLRKNRLYESKLSIVSGEFGNRVQR